MEEEEVTGGRLIGLVVAAISGAVVTVLVEHAVIPEDVGSIITGLLKLLSWL